MWGECLVEGDEVVVRLSRWRKLFATKSEIKVPLSSVSRIEHDPAARSHVRTGLRKARRHGGGLWRIGVYHGLDGWSFWSVGMGRNAVLMECSGQRFRFVVIEVADPACTVREVRSGLARVAGAGRSGQEAAGPAPGAGTEGGAPRGAQEPANGED